MIEPSKDARIMHFNYYDRIIFISCMSNQSNLISLCSKIFIKTKYPLSRTTVFRRYNSRNDDNHDIFFIYIYGASDILMGNGLG